MVSYNVRHLGQIPWSVPQGGNPLTFWPIFVIFWCAENWLKTRNIFGVSSQFSARQKMANMSEKVKGVNFFGSFYGSFGTSKISEKTGISRA